MKFCGNCGTKLEENKPFCRSCGAPTSAGESMESPTGTDFHTASPQSTGSHVANPPDSGTHVTVPHGTGTHMAHPHSTGIQHGTSPLSPAPYSPVPPFARPTIPTGYFQLGFFPMFLSSPLKAIENGHVSPGFATFVLFLSPLSVFLTIYATSWRAITDHAQIMVANRWTSESVAEIRTRAMGNLDWGAAFGATVLHMLIAFFILLFTVYLVMKVRGHYGSIDSNQFFSLAACITIVGTAFAVITSLVMFMSSSWGGFIAGLVTFTINGHTETMPPTPHNSILLAAVGVILLFLVVKRIFRASTEDAIIAVSVASVLNWTYQAFAFERVFYALYN